MYPIIVTETCICGASVQVPAGTVVTGCFWCPTDETRLDDVACAEANGVDASDYEAIYALYRVLGGLTIADPVR